jgi:hypothetical protein
VFENRVLRKVFVPKRDEVTGEWRKLPNIIRMIKSRRMRWASHVARMGETWITYRILLGKPEGKRPRRRPRRRWVDNLKMDLRDIGWGSLNYPMGTRVSFPRG